jgi:glycosyltransferase involved in cell wall biosynthesis
MAESLDRSRYRPFVISGHPGDVITALTHSNLSTRVIPLPPPTWRRPWAHVAARRRVLGEIRRQGAALVHVNDAPAFPIPGHAARAAGVPVICHVRFTYDAAGLRYALRHGFDTAVFASAFMMRYAQEQCPELFPAAKCAVIRNGFRPPSAPSERERRSLRAAIGLRPDWPVIGFFGQVIAIKGVEELLHAVSQLCLAGRAVQLLVVGDDKQAGQNYRTTMEDLSRRLGLAAHCTFTGYRSDVWRLMHLVDIVAMPSHVEPLGNVAIEAGAAHRPIVASRVGGLVEVVDDGRTGLLVPPRDAAALAGAIAGLLDNPALSRSLADAAARRVAADFSITRQADELQALYDRLLVCAPVAPHEHA